MRQGEKFRLREVRFEGVQEVEEDDLRDLMSVSPKKFLQPGSGIVTDVELDADISNLTSYYRLQGFGQAKVGPPLFEIEGQSQPGAPDKKPPVAKEETPPAALPPPALEGAAPEAKAETRPDAKAEPPAPAAPRPRLQPRRPKRRNLHRRRSPRRSRRRPRRRKAIPTGSTWCSACRSKKGPASEWSTSCSTGFRFSSARSC